MERDDQRLINLALAATHLYNLRLLPVPIEQYTVSEHFLRSLQHVAEHPTDLLLQAALAYQKAKETGQVKANLLLESLLTQLPTEQSSVENTHLMQVVAITEMNRILSAGERGQYEAYCEQQARRLHSLALVDLLFPHNSAGRSRSGRSS